MTRTIEPPAGGGRKAWLAALLCIAVAGCAVRRVPAGVASPPPCFTAGYGGAVAGHGAAVAGGWNVGTADGEVVTGDSETMAGSGESTVRDEAVRWIRRNARDERSALDAWCWGVGPAVYTNRGVPPADAATDSLLVVVWNNHLGEGDLPGLIGEIRSGRLTGEPEPDFVLLLQEVLRGGAAVPATVPDWGQVARRSGDRDVNPRPDVVRIAHEQGLSLLYAPSMRNGEPGDGGPLEDRGNAILSTLPLADPTLIELPWERQRRVAVAATVRSRTSDGLDWQLQLITAHFDNRARFGRLHRSFGAARLRQASELVRALSGRGPAVLGADLNTWEAGAGALAVRVLREAFPLPEALPEEATAPLPWVLPDMKLDYMLFRLPDGWQGGYRVLDDTRGSDHRPLVGRIRVGEPFTAGASASG